MDNDKLIKKLEKICGLQRPPLTERLAKLLQKDENKNELSDIPVKKDNIFYIERKKSVRFKNDNDIKQYLHKIKDTKWIDTYRQNGSDDDGQKRAIEHIGKVADNVNKYFSDEKKYAYCDIDEAAEKIVSDIESHIMGSISKFSQYVISKGLTIDEFIKNMIKEMNKYLGGLGVYSYIVEPNEKVLDAYKDYYIPVMIPDKEPFIVSEVICPAYVIDFIDEDGDVCKRTKEGRYEIKSGTDNNL